MCRYLLVVLLLSTVPALAEDTPTKEPAALVHARAAYEAKVKAAVDPIKAAYLQGDCTISYCPKRTCSK